MNTERLFAEPCEMGYVPPGVCSVMVRESSLYVDVRLNVALSYFFQSI